MSDSSTNDTVQAKSFSGLMEKVPLFLLAITTVIIILAYYLKEPKLALITVLFVIIYYNRYRRRKDNIKYGFEASLINISAFVIFISFINILIIIILKIIQKFI